MPILSDKELFDFEGYARRITELEGVTQAWAQSAVTSVNRIRAAFEEAQREVAPLKEGLRSVSITKDGADRQIVDYIQKIGQAAERSTAARQSLNALSDAQKLNAQVITELTTKFDSLQRKIQSLDPDQKDYAKQQRAILGEVKTVTRAIDAQSKSLQVSKSTIDAAEGSYNHLKKQTSDLKKNLDALPGAYDRTTGKLNEQNKAAVALNEQYQKNITLLHKVEQGQKNFRGNVGNYPQAAQPGNIGGKVVGAVAGLGIVDRVIGKIVDSVVAIKDITLQFDSLDSALNVVSNDTALLTQRQAMLRQMSENLGQDLSVVERNYTNLTASSKGTRLEGAATDKIFEQIVGTMARLKKPAEDVNGALLAVGQIMSKGTVQSEELRGQLGERLPGAFNIAAKSLGVTTQKLGDMLKNGGVLASEFLPKFAAELEKTFNPNNERRVEGLGANLARLRNEAVELVKALNIGDKAGEWIGNITRMARSIRELFTPAVDLASQKLAEQTETVNRLESTLPGLLARYDELGTKAKLSTGEQTELRGIINQLANIVPDAATGFDRYGNALDINKSKVLSFASAQRELNAELNKAAISALRDKVTGSLDRANKAQATLNRGTKQQSFNFLPYGLRSDEEKRKSTDKDAGKRREVKLSDEESRGLVSTIQSENKGAELAIMQRLQLGDKLTEADKKYINYSNNANLKRIKVVEDYNVKIAELDARQADLYIKGDKDSVKKREAVLKELKSYKDKVTAILNPSLSEKKAVSDKPELSQAATNKARIAAEKALNEALAKSKAVQEKNLALLNNDRQDGLVDEQTYIEKQLEITLKGINQRQALVKKESKDYLALLEERADAELKYKRGQLQLDLKTNKSNTAENLAKLDPSTFQNGSDDLAYIEQRHDIIKKGIERDQATIKEAGQQESQLYRDAGLALLKEQADYLKEKARVEEKAWKEQLTQTKNSLGAIDDQIKTNLEKQLSDLEESHDKQAAIIQKKMAKGSISEPDGEKQLADLKLKLLNDSMVATEAAYQKDETLSRALVEEKIHNIEKWLDAATRTPVEIADAEASIAELRKGLEENLSKDKMRLASEVADHQKKVSKEGREGEVREAKFSADERKRLWDQTIATIETVQQASSAIISNSYQKDIDSLTSQKEREVALVGDNAEAKARIEKNYDRQIAETRKKQAVAERAAAIFQIGLNTSVAITDVLRTGGGAHYLDFGVSAGILSALITASGIAQIAAVLSAPLPQYKLGKQASDSYTGPALVGEAGPELFVGRDGSTQLLEQPTLINTHAGDTVYTASQTSTILSNWKKRQVIDLAQEEIGLNNHSFNTLQSSRQPEMKVLLQELLQPDPSRSPMTAGQFESVFMRVWQNAPRHETIIDFEGMKQGTRQANNWHEYREKRYKW